MDNISEMPTYGDKDFKGWVFEDDRVSSPPPSYVRNLSRVVTEHINASGGIFLDVAAGNGELARRIEESTHVQSVSIDLSIHGFRSSGCPGAVATAGELPLSNNSVGVFHIKDALEHFNDRNLAQMAKEAKRVLINGGVFIITDQMYEDDINCVTVVDNDRSCIRNVGMDEDYSALVSRMKSEFGEKVTVNIPIYARTYDKIIQTMEKLNFAITKRYSWQPKQNEPDWWTNHPRRHVLVFKQQ